MDLSDQSKQIFDALSEGIMIVDSQGIIQYANSSYSRITKVDPHDIIGRPLRDARPGSRLTDVVNAGKAILRAPRFYGDIEYMTNLNPIKNADGIVVGGISTVIEMQEVYELNKELEQFRAKLAQLETTIRKGRSAKYSFDDIIYGDSISASTIQLAQRMAKRDLSVMISGESGTGKELYAHAIHNESQRCYGPFVALNCATFDTNLLESELFGYKEGAFTGAKKGGKVGLFELANNGTLFLDEVSELDYHVQARLLRVFQEGVIRPLGSTKEVTINVRIITASNKNLVDQIENKLFREDLYYRIAVMPLSIPPLRQRKGDIIPLSDYFLAQLAQQEKMDLAFSPQVTRLFAEYGWPGNIRELKNTVHLACYLTDEKTITPAHLPAHMQAEGVRKDIVHQPKLKKRVRLYEMREILNTLEAFEDTLDGKRRAAEYLGISLATLYSKLNKQRDV